MQEKESINNSKIYTASSSNQSSKRIRICKLATFLIDQEIPKTLQNHKKN